MIGVGLTISVAQVLDHTDSIQLNNDCHLVCSLVPDFAFVDSLDNMAFCEGLGYDGR